MTTNEWELVRIRDIGKVVTGRTPPTVVTSYFGEEYPFITPSDMIGDKYISNPERGLSSEGAALLKNNCLPPKSIAVSCIGWQMGKVVMISRPSFTNQQINTIIPADQVVPDFIYYNLCTRREELKTLGSVGTRTPILIKSSFENFQILLPPLPTQHKIASVLSAYDDLIENNTRRMAILEEMAQSLYREWFVHFRFPGREKKRLVESELGLIPEGWEVRTFGEVAINFDSKRKPLSSLQRAKMKGEYPYYGAAKIFDYIDAYIFDGKYLLIAEDGSVISDRGKPVLQMAIGKFWSNNHTHVIQGKQPISTDFLYLFMSDFDISGYITGAAQPKITQANLNRIPIIVPHMSLLEKFDEIVGYLLSYSANLKAKNANLRQTRDLLLPKLISGEVDVEGLNIHI